MKFNMGCGLNKRPGCINVDSSPESAADEVWDLEKTPWPWPSDCAEEVFFIHSLEHMGGDPQVFMAIMQELYRIAKPGCRVEIHVPHPRHDNFLADPTHVRPILPQTLALFDRSLNESWREQGLSNTPLAFYLGVDFRLTGRETRLDQPFAKQFKNGELSEAEVRRMIHRENNVATEYRLTLEVHKDLPAA